MKSMEKRIYETSKRERYRNLLITFIATVCFLAYIVWKDNWYGLMSLMPALFSVWYAFQKYILTPQGLIIERGVFFKYEINKLDWDIITKVTLLDKKVRIDYARPNGCKGFYMAQIDDCESFYRAIEKHLSNRSSV